MTNLIGISVSGALVFLIMGYTPLHRARKGLIFSAAAMVLLALPLGLSMRELILENRITNQIKKVLKEKTFTFRGVELDNVQVDRLKTPMRVTATVTNSEQPITTNQVRLVQDFLTKEIGIPIDFHLRVIPTKELTGAEILEEDLAQDP